MPRILLIFSDVDKSPQLIAIVNRLQSQKCDLKVLFIGSKQSQVVQEISRLAVDIKVVSSRNKYTSPLLFWSVLFEMISRRPTSLYASGQFASAVGIFCSFFLRVPNRSFTRHHSNFHHRYDLKLGAFVDCITNVMATQIVAVSEVVKNILMENEKVSEKKITVIRNGIDLERFSKSVLNGKGRKVFFGESNDHFKIGMISRMTDWKGVEYGARAFTEFAKTYPNAHLTIIGAFSDSYERVKDVLKPLPIENYTLEEFRDDIPSFLSCLDVFIHVPIGPQDEAFGIVYIEALTVGTASVFTVSGVLHELIDSHKHAEIVPYMNSDAILQAMKRIINKKPTFSSKAQAEWLEIFSIDLMSNRYASLILGRESQ